MEAKRLRKGFCSGASAKGILDTPKHEVGVEGLSKHVTDPYGARLHREVAGH